MGPNDGYILQYSRDTNCFWAERNSLALGACLGTRPGSGRVVPKRIVGRDEFNQAVETGFQATYMMQQGSIVSGAGAVVNGVLRLLVHRCSAVIGRCPSLSFALYCYRPGAR